MAKILKRIPLYIWIFALAAGLLALINHRWGSTYVGLDNISPFWGFDKIIAQIEHSGNYFTFGPILFSWWFGLFTLIGISASAQSFLYVYGYLFLSLIGYYLLAKRIVKWEIDRPQNILSFVFVFFISLVPLWIFSTHVLMFMSVFTAFPYLYLLVSSKTITTRLAAISVITVPMFFSSSINIVVFIVAFMILGIFLILLEKENIKKLFFRYVFVGVFFVLLTQVFIFITRGNHFITTELQNHLSFLSQSADMARITTDLQNAELKSSSFTNALRFSTGWMALYDENANFVFPWAKEFRSNALLISIQIIGILALLLIRGFYVPPTKFNTKLFSILGIGVALLSPVGLVLISTIPFLGIALRSASTKLWLLLFVPLLILEIESICWLLQKRINYTFLISILIFLAIPIYPWLTKQVFNENNAPIIPREYESFYSSLDTKDRVLILPQPQVVYFRKYTWGYYGSDLVSYMTKAKIIDASSLGNVREIYKTMTNQSENSCLITTKYLVVEKTGSFPSICSTKYQQLDSTTTFSIYKKK